MERELLSRLAQVQRRLRQQFCWVRLAVLAAVAAALTGLIAIGPQPLSRGEVEALGGAILLAVGFVFFIGTRQFRSLTQVAQQIERGFPELQQGLITAVWQLQRPSSRPRGFLETTVLQQALRHGLRSRWTSIVSSRKLWVCRVLTLAGLGLAGLVLFQIGRQAEQRAAIAAAQRREAPMPAGNAYEVTVQPGDAEVERGAPLIVSARFAARVPRAATLWIQPEGQPERRVEMRRSLEDPLFAVQLPQVDQAATYRVEFAGQASPDYRLNVFEYPELLQADALLDYPDYTQLPDKQISDTRRVSAVEGSRLTWTARLNKPVTEAWLTNEEGQRLDLQAAAGDAQAYQVDVTLATDQRWTLHLLDEAGRANKLPAELLAQVLANRPPELKPIVARDLSVSPLEELTVSASAWDDFGITRYGVAYALATAPGQEQVLGRDVAAQQETALAYQLDFESLKAQPDQLLAYHFWVEDIGPDGQPRRTLSDIYFADVRHFEEIFRQGQAPPGGQMPAGGQMGQNAQQAEQLLEVQKQVVSATWNLQRRETKSPVSDRFVEDAQLLVESQQQAIENLEQLSQRIADGQSAGYVEEIRLSMTQAVEHLQRAATAKSTDPLADALAAEQASYQGLLRLRAREHEVIRASSSSAGGGGGGGGGSARQQQLQELELDDDVNRYETQRQAEQQGEQAESERELRQILSRLRDLARRQQDINKQLRELQLALQQASTPEEQAELERQLKRLRDQQEQLLRDADETRQRMDQARNQPQMRDVRQQLEQSRERLQESAEATSEGDVSQALAAGSRAERQFQDMANQLRQQAANQFGERMQALRQSARQLDEEQEKIGQQLRDTQQPSPGLRANNDHQQLVEQLGTQQLRLQDLLNDMQQTVRDAETAEPLLAQKLYDAYRDASRQQIDRQLQTSRQLLENGLPTEAETSEAAARQGIGQLRANVEDAAEGILGDETEGLRRAAGTLAELAQALNQELDRFDPQTPRDRQQADQGTGQPSSEAGEQTPGQADQQASDGSPRQRQPGAGQRDEAQQEGGQSGRQTEGQQQDGQAQSGGQRGQQQGGEQQGGEQQGGEQQGGEQQGGQQQGSQQQGSQQQGSQQQGGQQQGGQQQGGQQQGGQQQGGQQQGGQPDGTGGRDAGGLRSGDRQATARDGGGLMQSFGESLGSGPISGDAFGPWSDRLRDVEEMVNDAELSARAAQIRDRARNLRRDMKRNSEPPQWELVREMIASPLEELRQAVEQELARRSGQREQLVPVDRDPVPDRFGERVRRYYERLGQGE